jgi:hypothetical protein
METFLLLIERQFTEVGVRLISLAPFFPQFYKTVYNLVIKNSTQRASILRTILLTILDTIIGRKNTTHTIAIKMDVAKIIKMVKIGKKRGTRNSI